MTKKEGTLCAPNRVEIISENDAPHMAPAPVTVHYVESRVSKTIVVEMKPPTYFDKIVVSIVHDVLPRLTSPQIALSSIRNAARFGYHVARDIETSIRSPRTFAGLVFDTRSWEPNNMSHLLLDLIPFSLYARNAAGRDVTVLFRKLGKRFCELLDLFGVVPVFERRRVEADVVKLRGTRGLAVYDLDLRNTFDCPGITIVPNVYAKLDFSSHVSFDKIFLARRGSRSLLNQTEVEETVAKFGYTTIFMEDYSLSDQLSIGTHAKHVVSIHGAAMSFLVMSKRIESIVELLPPNNYAAWFPVSLGSRVMHYEQIIPNFDQRVAHSGWAAIAGFKDQSFAVDTELLRRRLSVIH
jgi:Glycosyltransferase 61